ncbi:MAG: transposase [Pseudomonadota bacterium]
MMGERRMLQRNFFYEFSLEDHVPRRIDRFVDLSVIRRRVELFYIRIGRPSIDPERRLRILIIGYRHGIRTEPWLCQEVHLNLAHCWFCGLDLNDPVLDHSTFSKTSWRAASKKASSAARFSAWTRR